MMTDCAGVVVVRCSPRSRVSGGENVVDQIPAPEIIMVTESVLMEFLVIQVSGMHGTVEMSS